MKEIIPLEYGKYYHIYNRGINSDILFKDSENYSFFMNLYDKHINPIAETYAWCLMKNHFHFCVRIKEKAEIENAITKEPSQYFSNLFNAYTKSYNKRYHRHGPLFERPFRRKSIESNAYLQNLIVYIHRNPVHHRICSHPIEYPWSSYLTCVSDRPTKLNRTEVLDLFEGLENFRYVNEIGNFDINEFFLGDDT